MSIAEQETSTAPERADSGDAAQVSEFVHVDPATLVIGANVRIDRRDAKEFAASIKARGVLEAITAYRDEEGALVVLRGQRRAVVAASVGTPTGTVPVRVVPAPQEADRITDQITENVHRAAMSDGEVRDGMAQLVAIGVSAAQVAKRLAVPRASVTKAVAVAKSDTARARMDADHLTLEDAAIYAEFEDDPDAIAELDARPHWTPIAHLAQKLRDRATERREREAEADQARAEGLPVIEASQLPRSVWQHELEDLVDAEGNPVAAETWPQIPGASVVIERRWVPADPDEASTDDDGDSELGEREVWARVWVCTDPAAAGLHHPHLPRTGSHTGTTSGTDGDTEADHEAEQAAREARSAERRLVIANNAAWRSAETVRRRWLTQFFTRKSAPVGAEALICQAVVVQRHHLSRALDNLHPRLLDLLPSPTRDEQADATTGYHGSRDALARLHATARTAKAATMLTLACVLAAWEDSTSVQTWRGPSAWDAEVLTALIGWGYEPSDVERVLLQAHPDRQDDTGENAPDGAGEPDPTA